MLDCRWLLGLIIIGLATREASSMNEQSRMKNDPPKTRGNDPPSIFSNTNSDGKEKSRNEFPLRDRNQMLHSSPATTATAGLAVQNSTTVALAPDTVAGTSMNDDKLGSHDQSHSKRHFHRSKLYRKEARAKSRASLTKSNVASGNLIPFSISHFASSSQDLFHNPGHSRDSSRLHESVEKNSSTSPSRTQGVTSSRDDFISTTSSRSLFTGGSKVSSDGKFDALSSTENWYNSSSSSSEVGSMINDKSSSVELIAFTFDNVEEVRNSTTPNRVVKELENSAASSPITMNHFSSTTGVTVQTSRSLIDNGTTISDHPNYGGIDHSQSIQSFRHDADPTTSDDHVEESRNTVHTPSSSPITSMTANEVTNDDSIISVSVPSESSVSRSPRHLSSKGPGGSNNKPNSMTLGNNSNQSRSDVDEYSWVSVNDSSNRISLTELIDTLKNIDSQDTGNSYSYSNSTMSQDTDTELHSEIDGTDTDSASAKHSRSLIVSNIAQGPKELRPSMTGDTEIKSSDRSSASPANISNEKIDSPMKLIVPLIVDAITKAKTKSNAVIEDVKVSRPSTSTDLYSKMKSSDHFVATRKAELFRLAFGPDSSSSQCSSESSTEGLRNAQKTNSESPVHHRPSDEMTLAFSGNSIPDKEQCLTRGSSAQQPHHSTHEPERLIEALVFPVNESHETEVEATKSPRSAIDEHQGGQNLVSSSFILLNDPEPVVHESFASREASAVPFDTETTTAGHFFRAFADPEEHCNVSSSYDIFIPSVNSRDSIAADKPTEEEPLVANNKPQNITTTEDSLYIIEGFGFLKNVPDDISELDDIFDRKRDVSFDYSEAETYPGYLQLDDHPPAVKLLDQIDIEAELPLEKNPFIATGLRWRGNVGDDRDEDSWWFNNSESNPPRGQVDINERPYLIPSEFPILKKVNTIPSLVEKVPPDMTESNIDGYRIFLLPTVYVLIGICVVLVGCSIWCSKVSAIKRQPKLPKLTYFIQERQLGATQAV